MLFRSVDQVQTSKDFEKGFWKGWLEQYGYALSLFRDPVGSEKAVNNCGKEIEKRCEFLGLDIEQYASISKKRIEGEIKKRKEAKEREEANEREANDARLKKLYSKW